MISKLLENILLVIIFRSSSCQVVDNVDKLFSFINNVSYSQIGKSVGKGDFNNGFFFIFNKFFNNI